jgi:two-component system, chemotaxis family, protein-glutamate methylesterase/glutaminase
MAPIRVLIVDDSAFMRHALSRLINEAPRLEVVGAAANGEEGLRLAAELRPDVITLDVEMPVLDGLGMLKRLMLETPTRVVMLSSRTTQNAQITLDSLEYGAIDFVPKPSGSLSIDIGRVGEELVGKIEAAATMPEASFLRHRQVAAMTLTVANNAAAKTAAAAASMAAPGGANAPAAPGRLRALPDSTPQRRAPRSGPRVVANRLVVVASSTGGPSALHTLVRGFPESLGAAVAIVQHMPPGFTASLAARLDFAGKIRCSEATSEDVLVEDEILVAPGDRHMICSTSGRIQLVHLPPVNGVRPAADVTLQAVAPIWKDRLLCVVLTGMGVDAREGARAVKYHGGTVISQDAATATIYGMPAAVAEAGLSDQVLPLHQIADAIAAWCARSKPETSPGAQRTGQQATDPGLSFDRPARRGDRSEIAS